MKRRQQQWHSYLHDVAGVTIIAGGHLSFVERETALYCLRHRDNLDPQSRIYFAPIGKGITVTDILTRELPGNGTIGALRRYFGFY